MAGEDMTMPPCQALGILETLTGERPPGQENTLTISCADGSKLTLGGYAAA